MPKTLTRAQFLARRPKGNYNNYLKYIKAPRAAAAKRATDARIASMDPTSPWSPMQMEAEANKYVQGSLAPQRLEIQRQQEGAAQLARQQQERITGFGKAAAEMMQGQIAPASDAYLAAVRAQEGLGAATTAGQTARLAGVPGAAQEGDARAAALEQMVGTIPANSLAENALNYTREAVEAPKTSLGYSALQLQNATRQQSEEDQKYRQAMIDLAAKAPELRADIMTKLRDHELQKIATRINMSAMGVKQKEVAFDQAYKQAGLQIDLAAEKRLNREATLEAQRQGQEIDSDWSRQNGFASNAWGEPILKNGAQIPWKEKPASKRGGTKDERNPVGAATTEASTLLEAGEMVETPQKYAELHGRLNPVTGNKRVIGKYIARDGVGGYPADKAAGIPATTDDPAKAKVYGRKSYVSARSYLMGVYKITAAQAEKALNDAGWKKPKKTVKNARPGPGSQRRRP